MAKKLSQIQIVRTEIMMLKRKVIKAVEIIEQINDYNHEKDVLGPERMKSERIRELINSLKDSLKGE